MKKYLSLLVMVLIFCAVSYRGCGGGFDNNFASSDSGDTQTTTDDTDTTGGYGRTLRP